MAINTSTDNYRQTLGQLKKALLTSRFMRWWLGELYSMVPRHLKPAGLNAESFPLLRHDDSVVWIDRFHDGQMHNADSLLVQSGDPEGMRSSLVAALGKAGAAGQVVDENPDYARSALNQISVAVGHAAIAATAIHHRSPANWREQQID